MKNCSLLLTQNPTLCSQVTTFNGLNSDGLPNIKGKVNRLDEKLREERKGELVSIPVLCSGRAIIKNNGRFYLQLKLKKKENINKNKSKTNI